MNSTTHNRNEIVRVSIAQFEQFLEQQENKLWDVEGTNLQQFLTGRPSNVEELMLAIQLCGGNSDYVYIFNNDDPYEIANRTNWDSIPEVGVQDLEGYTVRVVRGKDFLWFACSQEEASNGEYTTLLPYEGEYE